MDSLYGVRLDPSAWTRLCGGNDDPDGSQESCVTVQAIPGVSGALAFGHTEQPGAEVRYTRPEWEAAFGADFAEKHGITV